jgi:hypothetical protein
MACSRRDTSASAGRVVSCLAANTLVGNLQRPVDFVQASSTRLLLHTSQQGTSLSACNSSRDGLFLWPQRLCLQDRLRRVMARNAFRGVSPTRPLCRPGFTIFGVSGLSLERGATYRRGRKMPCAYPSHHSHVFDTFHRVPQRSFSLPSRAGTF